MAALRSTGGVLLLSQGASQSMSGFAIKAPGIAISSNLLAGVSLGALVTNVPGGIFSLVDNAGSQVAVDTVGNLTTGTAPTDFTTSGGTITPIVKVTSPDGKTSVQLPLPLPVTQLSVTLNALGLSSNQTVAGLPGDALIANITGRYAAAANGRAPSRVKLCSDTAGTLYTGTKLRLNTDNELVTAPGAFAAGQSETAFIQEDMGGTLRYTPVTVTGVANVAPSGLTWTPNGSAIYEYCGLGMQTVAGVLSCTNPGPNDFISYTLTSNPGGYFDVDHSTGEVYPVRDIVFANAASYPLTAQATDGAGLSVQVSFTINVAAFSPAAFTDTFAGTSLAANLDLSLAANATLDGSGNINTITGAFGSTWSKVGATGPAYVTGAQNGNAVARFTAGQALKCTDAAVLAVPGVNGAPKPYSILLALKNNHTGATTANIMTFVGSPSAQISYLQTANDAAVSVNSNALWTAIPNGGATTSVIFTSPSALLQYLNNVPTGATTNGAAPIAGSGATSGFIFGGNSLTVAPGAGFVGDLMELAIVSGVVTSPQRDAWSKYVTAKWGFAGQYVTPGSIDLNQYVKTFGEEFDNPALTWYDPDLGTAGPLTPTLPSYNGSNAAGSAQIANPEDCWMINPRNKLLAPIYEGFKRRNSRMAIKADKTPGALGAYIGSSFYPNSSSYKPGPQYTYTGGAATTQDQFKQMFGYFEFRMQLDSMSGEWPGTWMYSAEGDQWELDFIEILTATINNSPLRSIQFTTHNPAAASNPVPITNMQALDNSFSINGTQFATTTGPDFSTQTGRMALFGVDWQPDWTTYYLNGKPVGRHATPTSATQCMFMLIDLTIYRVGTPFASPPDANATFPIRMYVDYMRAYKKKLPAPAVVTGTNAKTTAFVNAVTSAGGSLSNAEQAALNTFYNSNDAYTLDTRNAGTSGNGMPDYTAKRITDKRDGAFCFLFADPIAQKMDLFRFVPATTVGGVTLTPSGGVKGDGTTGYLDTGYDLVTNAGAGKLSARDASYDAWVLTPPSTTAQQWLMGNNIVGFALDPVAQAYTLTNGGSSTRNANLACNVTGSTAPSVIPGLYGASRLSNQIANVRDSVNAYRNGGWLGFRTRFETASAFTAGKPLQILGQNGTNARTYTDASLGFASWGAGMMPDEEAQWYANVRALLNALNPTLVP